LTAVTTVPAIVLAACNSRNGPPTVTIGYPNFPPEDAHGSVADAAGDDGGVTSDAGDDGVAAVPVCSGSCMCFSAQDACPLDC
jgi:hypothetical protein